MNPDTSYQELLVIAIRSAIQAHGTKMSQDGTLYILHPIRLMMKAESTQDKILAILHDTIEDTYITIKSIEDAGFPKEIIEPLEVLTRRPEETNKFYEQYIERISKNPAAIRIKLLDLEDNIDLTRLDLVGEYELQRAGKYHRAIQYLKKIQQEAV